MNNESYHLILGSLNFPFPNMKPPNGTPAPLVPAVVIYTPDIANYLSGEEIDLYSQFAPIFEKQQMELAIQVAVLIGPSGIVYHKIAMDFIRTERNNPPIMMKLEGDFILTKRTLPYEETFATADLEGGQDTPPPYPLLRSAICDFNYVADANSVLDQKNVEEWLSSFGQMEIGKNMLTAIFSRVPEYGSFMAENGFVNQHSAGWSTRDINKPSHLRSHFYKAESSLNSIPLELYKLDYMRTYTWQVYRPELFDKYGGHTHYSLAYQFNRKGSYYRQGLDGNQWYPSNTDPSQHDRYSKILGNEQDGNLTPYNSPTIFEEHLSPENFYDINLKRTLYSFDRVYGASAISLGGMWVTGATFLNSGHYFYKYNIYVKSPLYREFMTGGRLGLYANFADFFKAYKSRNPLSSETDDHSLYEGDQPVIEYTVGGNDNNPSPTGKNFAKSMVYWEQYIFAGGDPLNFAWMGFIEGASRKMIHYPHDGFMPSLVFDVNWVSSAESLITYPILDRVSTDPNITKVVKPKEEETGIKTTLMTTQILQRTYSMNLEMTLSPQGVNLEQDNKIDYPCDLYKSINFLPISAYEAIYNIPVKDSSLKTPDIGSTFGSFMAEKFEDYIYWASVDGPIIIQPPPSDENPNPLPIVNKLLVCFGSDLEITMVDHAKICNRCYNMVRTTACTASSMPSPICNNVAKLNDRLIYPSNMTFALEYNWNQTCKYGASPPNPRNFYLDHHIKSTVEDYSGGFLNLPVIENTDFNYDWRTILQSIWYSNPPIEDPDLRNVTAFRPWKDKINYGRNSVFGRNGLARSTIFDYAWNLSIDGKTRETIENNREMKISQGVIQNKGFSDLVGNVPVSTLNRRVNETGMIHGGLYAYNTYSYANIYDASMATVGVPYGGFTLIGLMGTLGAGSSAGVFARAYMAFNKADYVRGLVVSTLYNHTAGEIGVALGSGCSNISIYCKKVEMRDKWASKPEMIYQYYGYAASPHYIGLHPEGYLWIPTDIGYYVYNDTGKVVEPPAVEEYKEEREHEWCHPLLRTGYVNSNFSDKYPTVDEKLADINILPATTWDEQHEYPKDSFMVKYNGAFILPYEGSNWNGVPLVKASDIYKDTVFTVVGSYGQVTNGDSSYWQYVENFLDRDLKNKEDLDLFNVNN